MYLDPFFYFAEEVVYHTTVVYEGCGKDRLEDVLYLLELLLQYCIMVADLIDDDALMALRDF